MKSVAISILVAGLLIGGAFLFSGSERGLEAPQEDTVSIVEGTQIIEIFAKGGYSPRRVEAQAGIPTVIRFRTKGTFDCSAAVIIPSKGISKILPQTGSTDIDIGENGEGTLYGSCGMGMYPFEIRFAKGE